jgi:hypothetical protein
MSQLVICSDRDNAIFAPFLFENKAIEDICTVDLQTDRITLLEADNIIFDDLELKLTGTAFPFGLPSDPFLHDRGEHLASVLNQ